jgi:hypothetical protein
MYALLIAALQVAAPGDAAPTFAAVSAVDEGESGRLIRLSPDFTAVLTRGNKEFAIKEVIGLRRSERPLPPLPNGPHLITTSGDRIAGRILDGDSQALRFLPSGLELKDEAAWKVPFNSAAILWLTATPADTPIDPAQYDWLAGNRNRDVFRFRNGDIDKGALSGLDGDARFNLRPEKGMDRTLRMEELAAVAFNPVLARIRKPKGQYARVILADGSRLALQTSSIDAGVLKGETLFGLGVTIPVREIVGLDVFQGKALYISDLKPKKSEQAGFLSVTWPWAADRNVQGRMLRVATSAGESTFEKGVGTHPRSMLYYDLGGKYRRFEALIGYDPDTTIRSHATVRVLVDGKEQEFPDLPALKTGNAIPIRVNLKGAKELVLITDFGTAGGIGADVNWCEARLLE